MALLFLIALVVIGFFIARIFTSEELAANPKFNTFKPVWRKLLFENVVFYKSLDQTERQQFENRVLQFLRSVRITGIKTTVEDIDRMLVASSAIIPVFAFPDWKYKTIREVLLYPDLFNHRFEFGKSDSKIGGMVGTGAMDGIMILAKPLLRLGYDINNDKMNVGIHEFMHLIDMEDGEVDGVPGVLMKNAASLPWMELCKTKINQILQDKSDINPYGATNSEEFFAVAGEYFFERPDMLKQKHPELYAFLEKAFRIKMSDRFHKKLFVKTRIRRNSPCPCGSSEKFKNCCGNPHAA